MIDRAPPAADATHDPAIPAATDTDRRPLDIRSLALTAIAAVLVLHAVRVAAPIILPLYIAMLATLLLTPVVAALGRLRVPTALGALVVLTALVVAAGTGVTLLASPVQEWMGRAPTSIRMIEHKVRVLKEPLAQVTDVTNRVESMADVSGATAAPVVQVARPPLREVLVSGTIDLALSSAIVLVLMYFLLISGGALTRKIIAIQPQPEQRRRIVAILRTIDRDISRYLLTVCGINAVLGATIALATHLLSMPNPLLWGTAAAVLNFVPFIGPFVTGSVLALAALLSFADPWQALLVPLTFFLITGIEGFVVTPALLGRRLDLSPIAVLISLLLCAWLWGIPGALLAVPTLAIVRIVSGHHPSLQRLGVLLER